MYIEANRCGALTFSLCVPQYNRTSFLLAALQSYQEQEFGSFEICISDGGSTDGREQEVIDALVKAGLPFVYSRAPARLAYDANTRSALGLARGKFCVLMGNDDALNGRHALAALWEEMQKHWPVGVVLNDHCDYRTGERAYRIRQTALFEGHSRTAAMHYRNFSFVSGVVLEREPAQALATDLWDGSEMYQTFVGCRMIASGKRLLERGTPLVRKDILVPGESVDTWTTRPRIWPCPVTERQIPLGQLGRLVADAIGPEASPGERQKLNEAILLQLLGLTYPFWLFEYRRVQSWRYAAGIALGMKPNRTASGVDLGFLRFLRIWMIYSLATALGLTLPGSVFEAMKNRLYRIAKSIR